MLRYPAKNGAKIAFYVAQWPSARLNHWLALLKARAIENDMYVVCSGCGNDGVRWIFDSYQSNGEIVQELGSDEGVLTTNVDLELVDQQRVMMETRSTLDIRQLSIQMVRLFKNWAVMKVSSPLM